MSKTIHDLKKRMKAPRNLVEAVKKGERLEPALRVDTRAVHLRRFSKAIAAYACVVVLLIGAVFVLPGLPDSETPQAPATTTTGVDLPASDKPDYVYPPKDDAQNYFRPELIWVNDLNPGLVDTIIWAMQSEGEGYSVLYPYTIPEIGGEDAQFAIELRFERVSGDVEWPGYAEMIREMQRVKRALTDAGFEEIDKKNTESNDLLYRKYYFAADRAQMESLNPQTLTEAFTHTKEGIRTVMKLAWQGSGNLDERLNFYDTPLTTVDKIVTADTSLLPEQIDADEFQQYLIKPLSAMEDEKKATVIAKKIGSNSCYHTYSFGCVAPSVYTISTFEILSVEQETDFYYKGKGVQSRENPYQVGNTIQVIEWYGFAPSQSNAEKFVLYRSYPYPVRGIEMPDPAELGGIYRLSLIDGSALAEQDNIVAANCYDTAGGAEFSRSGVLYLAGVYLIADLEKAE